MNNNEQHNDSRNGVESGDWLGSVVWDFNVQNAIKADAEWWQYRNGCLRMWGDLTRACDSASRYVFEKTGRRIKAWISILPNIRSQRTRPAMPDHQPTEAPTTELRPGSL